MGQQPQPPINELAVVPTLPKGITPGTGVALAHDTNPIQNIVGNTVRVGNIMLIRLNPELTTQSDFQTIAKAVEQILNEVASVSS